MNDEIYNELFQATCCNLKQVPFYDEIDPEDGFFICRICGKPVQINSLIFSMQGYMATLDPDSPKYKEMQEKLNQLMEQFIL